MQGIQRGPHIVHVHRLHFRSAGKYNLGMSKKKGKTQSNVHLAPKPRDLIERLVRASSNEGDLVLDCFAGTGVVASVCLELKRNFLCADMNAHPAWEAIGTNG